MKIKLSERVTTVEDNDLVVSMEGVEVIAGSQRTISVGQGVKARIGVDSDGKKQVESILFDRDKYDESKVENWLENNEKSIVESLHLIQVNAPEGSFEDTAIRLQKTINDSDKFTGMAFVEFVFDDHAIISTEKGMFQIDWKEGEGQIDLIGEPVPVETQFVTKQKEALNAKLKGRNKPNCDIDETIGKFKVLESTEKDEGRLYKVILIEAGTSFTKKRHYPKRTIQEAAPLFAGLKMYLDHPTEREEFEKPERSLDQWMSTIVESWFEDGKALAHVHVHNKDFIEALSDSVFMEHVGISINASGRRHEAVIQGENMEVIDKIFAPRSVDWVTEAGARGRVLELVESIENTKKTKEILNMDLKEFKEKRKDLYEQIVAEVKESLKGETKEAIEKAVEEAVKPYVEKDQKAIRERVASKAKALIEGSGLPQKGIAAFCQRFLSEHQDLEEEKVEEVVKEAIKKEAEYLQSMGAGVKIGVGSSPDEEQTVVQEAQSNIEERLGLKKEEEKQD